MSPISIPGKVRLEYSSIGLDSDAATYIAAVEAADGQPLEYAVTTAIQSFVIGCKADGIWNAIKASCILAGARTLAGALVPLKGTAPTNYNFVSGDYNRELGLVGDGSTKYLNSNLNYSTTPQNSAHLGVYVTTAPTTTTYAGAYIGVGGFSAGDSSIFRAPSNGDLGARVKCATSSGAQQSGSSTEFIGASRDSAASFVLRAAQDSRTISVASDGNTSANVEVFKRSAETTSFINGRLSFYSIGEALDLALLDSRVSTLMTAIGAAIP